MHPLATSREESPLFRLSVISLVRNTNRKSVNSVYLSLFIRCGCIQPLGLHNTTSAPVEHLFSQAALVLTVRRNRLSDGFLDIFIFLKIALGV